MLFIPVLLGGIAALALIAQSFQDMLKRYVFIMPFTISLLVISAMTIVNYNAPGKNLVKLAIIAGIALILTCALLLDIKFNNEEKMGGADVVGFISILATIIGVGIMYIVTDQSIAQLLVWIGNNVFVPLLPSLVILGLIEFIFVQYKKRKGQDYSFQAPIVPAIVVVTIFMFFSSSIQYI